jgi:hypothetical protein
LPNFAKFQPISASPGIAAGLVHLKALTQLQCLSVRNTKVTAAGVKELQQALPKCEIIFRLP